MMQNRGNYNIWRQLLKDVEVVSVALSCGSIGSSLFMSWKPIDATD